jgi:hypothetical protein
MPNPAKRPWTIGKTDTHFVFELGLKKTVELGKNAGTPMYDAPIHTAPPEYEQTNTLGGRLLGVFVLFQLLFIPLANYIKLVPVRMPEHQGEIDGNLQVRLPTGAKCHEPMQSVFDATAWICTRWSEVSGQGQCWALFAGFGERASFPIVELRWTDGEHREPVRLKSHFEPADPTQYFYWPESCCRMWNYDNRMTLIHFVMTPKLLPDPEKYRQECLNCVRDMRHSMSAYLRWKVDRYLSAHPDLPRPETVTLIARLFPDPLPGASFRDRPAAFEIPLARWTPDHVTEPDEAPLEAWDPLTTKFVRLKLGDQP